MPGIAFKTIGGDGPDAVLIHGFGSDRLSWLGTSPALLPLAKVHALDLPAHGESGMEDVGDGSPTHLAGTVVQALDAQGIGRVHLVGHSLGGGLAFAIAAKHPERVASLSLIAPAGLGQGIDGDFLAQYPALADTMATTQLLQKLVARPQLINKMTVQRVLAQLDREGARPALAKIATQLVIQQALLSELADDIARLAIPRLTVWGQKDVINPMDEARLGAFGGIQVSVPEAGHLPHIEEPALVNRSLTGFLQSQATA